jgi:asparaginyl-tRNA synthetase
MTHTRVRDILTNTDVDSHVTACGWIRTRRDSKGGFSFLEINDGSCFGNLQVVANANLENYEEICRLHPGASVRVHGKLIKSPGGKQDVELHAAMVEVLGFCDPTQYPLGKQRVSFERLRELAHLRGRTNTLGAVMRVRNTLSFATHCFFQQRDFVYLNTPIITGSDCEGAGQMFQVTTLDVDKPPRTEKGAVNWREDFFGTPTNLTVSGQLEAETYACALGRVYTFGPTFRAENSNTSRHLAEFWMVEPEIAFANLAEDADLAEDYVKYLVGQVLENCEEDLSFFNNRIEPGLQDTLKQVVYRSFERITYREAIRILKSARQDFEYAVEWGCDLQSEHERFLTEQYFNAPVIVTDFPASIKPFYMRMNDDGETVAAMDVLVPHLGELIGGSQREERLSVLEQRMNACGLPAEHYWWYCDLRRFGTVPHAGFGLGFERIVQFCTGMKNIRDVIPFPRTPRNADF